jgi:hypothetical protein
MELAAGLWKILLCKKAVFAETLQPSHLTGDSLRRQRRHMFEQGVDNVLIVLFGKKSAMVFATTSPTPSILLISARASEPSNTARAALPACCDEKTGNLDRSTRPKEHEEGNRNDGHEQRPYGQAERASRFWGRNCNGFGA